MPRTIDFLRTRLPSRADAWEAEALLALTSIPSPIFPWPWVALQELQEIPPENEGAKLSWPLLRLSAEVGTLRIHARQCRALVFHVVADLAWTGLIIPEKVAYALIIERFHLAMPPGRTAPHPFDLPPTPAPGYVCADRAAPEWHVPLPAGTTVTIDFRNTSDRAVEAEIKGSALVLIELPREREGEPERED